MEEKTIAMASREDLDQVAAAVLDFAKGQNILLFQGEMAAGKTTLIKAICRQAGVTEPVSSPTYSLVNEYATEEGEPVYHFDFYRIQDETEALDMGVMEYLESGRLCLIEWPVNIAALLPEHHVVVEIEKGEGEVRAITLKKN